MSNEEHVVSALRTIEQLLGGELQSLYRDVEGPKGAGPREWDPTPMRADQWSYAARGTSFEDPFWNPKNNHERGGPSHVGIWLEHTKYDVAGVRCDGREYPLRVHLAVRLPTKHGVRMVDGNRSVTAMENMLRPAGAEFLGGIPVQVYPNESPVNSDNPILWVARNDKDVLQWDPRGLWLSIAGTGEIQADRLERGEASVDIESSARSLRSRLPMFTKLVTWARAVLSIPGRVSDEWLRGFAAEYVAWVKVFKRSDDVQWSIGRACFDFESKGVQYEVKSSVGRLPDAPTFTIAEIRHALNRGESDYKVVKVRLPEEETAAFLAVCRGIKNRGVPHEGPKWLRPFFAMTGLLPHDKERAEIEVALNCIERAAHLEIHQVNPFRRDAFKGLPGALSTVRDGALQVWI